jgi:hypothetical protein
VDEIRDLSAEIKELKIDRSKMGLPKRELREIRKKLEPLMATAEEVAKAATTAVETLGPALAKAFEETRVEVRDAWGVPVGVIALKYHASDVARIAEARRKAK